MLDKNTLFYVKEKIKKAKVKLPQSLGIDYCLMLVENLIKDKKLWK